MERTSGLVMISGVTFCAVRQATATSSTVAVATGFSRRIVNTWAAGKAIDDYIRTDYDTFSELIKKLSSSSFRIIPN